jgi:N-acetylgalactosamine kinase
MRVNQLLHFFSQEPAANPALWRALRRNYSTPDSLIQQRFHSLLQLHAQRFGDQPATLLRAPGRIELIGNHTDYNGCPVLTMAVDRDVLVVVSPRADQQIEIQNLNPQFTPRKFKLETEIPPFPTGDWGNYVKAAVQGLRDYLNTAELTGFNLSVSGEIPSAAGLSSSSALVVVSALSFLQVNQRQLDGLELAQILAQAEKYVGTQGGGMDQTISLLGEAGKALKIDFNPYATQPISLPRDFNVVVAHSLVYAPKTESAMDKFNRRAIECRLATAIIQKYFDSKFQQKHLIKLIGDLSPEKLGINWEEIFSLAHQALAEEIYTTPQIASILNAPETTIQQNYCRRRDGSLFAEPTDGFKLWQRFRHIFSEWQRVLQAAELLSQQNLAAFGHLMTAAQASSRDDYELSTPELDRLVELGVQNGALGSRLTGAGFGGCTLHLVPPAETEKFIETLKTAYYRQPEKSLPQNFNWDAFIFSCKAVDGAGVVYPN